MELPEIFIMARIRWQVFGTLTFKSARINRAGMLKLSFAELRTLAKWFHVYFPDLLWVLRIEQGERTQRNHIHCLIGGLPETATTDSVRFQRADGSWDTGNPLTHALEAHWGRLGLNPLDKQNQISRFSLYDARLNGASYIMKCLDAEPSRLAKDVYESAKFGEIGRQLILSESIYRIAKRERRLSACSPSVCSVGVF